MNPVSARLLNQQLVAPVFSRPEEVVSHFGAMQGQEYRLMRWAVAMRTKRPSAKAFKKAFDEGRIVRHHLLRGTWQLVAGEDYWWMHDLCAPKAERVIRGWMAANHIDIPAAETAKICPILLKTAEEKGNVTKEDFVQALAEHDITMDDHRLSYHIRFAELRGQLCNGDLLPMKATYSLVDTKLGASSTGNDKEESLSRLARKYFQSHAPATLEDFIWWSGFSAGECKKAIASLGSEISAERWQGREFCILNSCRTRGFRSGETLLLPSYDEYLIGYKSRDVVLPPEHRAKAHNNSGNFSPIIAHNGIICGNWSPFDKDPNFRYFTPDTTPLNESSRWSEYIASGCAKAGSTSTDLPPSALEGGARP